jgi:hypothetical protein
MSKNGTPCDYCITKAICLRKFEISCKVLTSYLKKELAPFLHLKFEDSYRFIIPYNDLFINVLQNQDVCIWEHRSTCRLTLNDFFKRMSLMKKIQRSYSEEINNAM